MELKTFQRTALEILEAYLVRARMGDPEQAFIQTLRARAPDNAPRPTAPSKDCPVFRMSASACRRAEAKPCWRRTL
jgi:hypothetical protein